MPREVDEITEDWRDEVHPRIVQAGVLRRVVAELDRLRARVAELEGADQRGEISASVALTAAIEAADQAGLIDWEPFVARVLDKADRAAFAREPSDGR